ncbi:MAG: PEP-CTERM sorting domain-containing protein [Verrucomicrobia bacterium]|nr:PEP-CTERM sorting domain-containing protein [Verrucomicrobiota bacterium]
MKSSPALRRLVCLAAVLTAGLVQLPAQSVSIGLGAGTLYGRSGTALPAGNLVLLIADTSHNGFGQFLSGSSLSTGSYLNGDDQILGLTFTDSDSSASDYFSNIPLASNPTPGAFTQLTSGDPLAIVWFDSLTASATVLSPGDYYGLFANGVSPTDGDPWVVPASSGSAIISFVTQGFDETGTHAESEGYASLSVAPIPEPATAAAFAGLLGLGFVVWRRRARA